MDNTRLSPAGQELPAEITANLNPAMPLRPYQQQAVLRLIRKLNAPPAQPQQLLFHMATGSGKTLIMAAAMLHMYRLGYRRFLFFVNSSNIIGKTRDNFLNGRSSKYLFARELFIGNRRVHIRADETFGAGRDDALSIVFTTIQGLHSRLNSPRENSLHDADFEQEKTVFLSDEAHHINAETKKGPLSREENRALLSWENSVNRVFRAHPQNVLLEFTATADLNHPAIRAKYRDKLLFDYSLARFRRDGYSKEVQVLQSDRPPFERALQALLLSLYRQKVFEKYGLPIKPVVLLKSKTIAESRRFFNDFSDRLRRLKRRELEQIEAANRGTVIGRAMAFFRQRGLLPEDIIEELRLEFGPGSCISVDSKNDSRQKQLLINSLEEPQNPYRLVFAVDKLNEGWDVLNLFDIVRLYDTRVSRSGGGQPAKTTLSEAQLIGRGARYCPFRIEEGQTADRRKFDDRPEHPLRIGELLYYHASYNPAYIAGLNRALSHIGMREATETRRLIFMDADFRQSAFYNGSPVFLNRRIPQKDPAGFSTVFSQRLFCHTLTADTTGEADLFAGAPVNADPVAAREMTLGDLGPAVLRKAVNRTPFFYFENLSKILPGLTSISTFINSPRYLAGVRLRLKGPGERLHRLMAGDALQIARQVLQELAAALREDTSKYAGSTVFEARPLTVALPPPSAPLPTGTEVPEQPGAVWGELPLSPAVRPFLQTYKRLYPQLRRCGATPFLIANRRLKLYRFEDGAAFIPDFILFIEQPRKSVRQLFITCRPETDPRDRKFLSSLRQSIRKDNKVYHISGLVFDKEGAAFEKAWVDLLRDIRHGD